MDEASFEHQPRSSNLPLARDEVRNNTVVDTIKFGAFYHAADVLWVGGALAGDTIAEHGVNRWVAAAGTAIAVTGAEYGLSNVAVETFERTEDIEKDMGTILTGSKIVKEVRKFFTRNRKTDAQDQM